MVARRLPAATDGVDRVAVPGMVRWDVSFEDGVRLHNRHVLAVHGQDIDAADDTEVVTVDLEAFNTPDGDGDQPPSVTLAINNPEPRTADTGSWTGWTPRWSGAWPRRCCRAAGKARRSGSSPRKRRNSARH